MNCFPDFSTTENVAVFIWESLSKILPENSLHEIKIKETDKNIVYFRGEYSNTKWSPILLNHIGRLSIIPYNLLGEM